jgi:hypothetical protein
LSEITRIITMSTPAADIESNAKAAPQKKGCTPKKVLVGIAIASACSTGAIVGIITGLTGGGGLVQGTWVSNYGSYITVTDSTWYSVSSWGTSVSAIDRITPKFVIMQNAADDAWNPSKWTKNEYHKTDDGWAFCSSVYDAATAADAIAFDTSAIYDKDDAAAGCNGFGHTTVTAYAMPIAGSWTTNWGSSLTIDATSWASESSWGSSTYAIEAYGANFALMQNPADDAYNPSKWTKMEFTVDGTDFNYCQSIYSGATATAALTADTSSFYDAANMTAGCNGFGHTVASKA